MWAIIGDFHLREQDKAIKLETLADVFYNNNYFGCIFTGDIFHKSQAVPALKLVKELTDVLANFNGPVIMLEGNHDQFGSQSGLDLIHLPNVTKVKDKPEYFGFEGYEIVCLPWLKNEPRCAEICYDFLNSIEPKENIRRVFGHCNIAAASMNRLGMTVSLDDHMVLDLEKMKRSKFAPTGGSFGHLHGRQRLATNFYYDGAFMQLSFGHEGEPQGYAEWDPITDKVTHIDLNLPQYKNITEGEYNLKSIICDNYYKFYTDKPEKYKDTPNLTALSWPKERNKHELTDQTYSGSLDLQSLISRYCNENTISIPDSALVKDELTRLTQTIRQAEVGVEQVESVVLNKVGPDPATWVTKEVEFKSGLNAIVGKNGKGKTSIVEAVPATFYGDWIQRGNVKNYLCEKDSKIAVSVISGGERIYVERHKVTAASRGIIGNTTFKDASKMDEAAYSQFGNKETFLKLAFLDQESKKDLVTASPGERYDIMSELLSLSELDAKRKEYEQAIKDIKKELEEQKALTEQQESLMSQLNEWQFELNQTKELNVEREKELEKNIHFARDNNELIKQAQEWKQQSEYLLDNYEVADWHVDYFQEYQNRKLKAKQLTEELRKVIAAEDSSKNTGCNGTLPCRYLVVPLTNKTILQDQIMNTQLTKDEATRLDEHLTGMKLKAQIESKYKSEYESILDSQITNIDIMKTELKALQSNREQRERIQKRVDDLTKRLQETKMKLYICADKEQELKDYEWLRALVDKKSLPMWIVQSTTRDLQDCVDELLEMADINLGIEINTVGKSGAETFEVLMTCNGSKPYEVSKASGGQKQMVKFLFKLALLRYLNKFFGNYKLLILDEPERGLDEQNQEALVNILRKLKHQLNQIIVVTHSDYIEGVADEVIRL